jgi:hypothetical protein
MESNPKREAALRLLSATGMKRSNYEPPLLRLLWRLGVDAPPPHFASFGANALVAGIFFGSCWGMSMWLFLWRQQAAPITVSLLSSVLAGLLFGIAMATYYAYGRRKYNLPSWHSLRAEVAGA